MQAFILFVHSEQTYIAVQNPKIQRRQKQSLIPRKPGLLYLKREASAHQVVVGRGRLPRELYQLLSHRDGAAAADRGVEDLKPRMGVGMVAQGRATVILPQPW